MQTATINVKRLGGGACRVALLDANGAELFGRHVPRPRVCGPMDFDMRAVYRARAELVEFAMRAGLELIDEGS